MAMPAVLLCFQYHISHLANHSRRVCSEPLLSLVLYLLLSCG